MFLENTFTFTWLDSIQCVTATKTHHPKRAMDPLRALCSTSQIAVSTIDLHHKDEPRAIVLYDSFMLLKCSQTIPLMYPQLALQLIPQSKGLLNSPLTSPSLGIYPVTTQLHHNITSQTYYVCLLLPLYSIYCLLEQLQPISHKLNVQKLEPILLSHSASLFAQSRAMTLQLIGFYRSVCQRNNVSIGGNFLVTINIQLAITITFK